MRWVLIAAAVLFVVLPGAAGFYTDWLWFQETGYTRVVTTEYGTRGLLWSVGVAVTFGWLWLNLGAALRTLPVTPMVWTGQAGVPLQLPGRGQFRRVALGLAALVALPAGFVASRQWMVYLAARHAVPFGASDPILGHDVAFYVFTLPLLEFARGALAMLVLLAAAGAGAVYVLGGHLALSPREGLIATGPVRRHAAALAALFFVGLAFGSWLDLARELVTSSGLVHGASYADVWARMPADRALVAVALVSAALAALSATRSTTYLIGAALLYVAAAGGGSVYASAVQRFAVAPNEQSRETPYIEHNIAATRAAFGLEDVEERELSGDAELTREDINRNAATLRNVRLWDHRPLLDTFGQLQEIRPYYDFVSVDNDRYVLNGELRQIMLSARELNSTALPSRSFINEHLTFTHGYGLTLGPVNQVTGEGLPVLFIKDLPPASSVDLEIKEPSLYFGELANEYVFVRTRTPEFHYPKGEDNVTTQYEGRGGVAVGSLWRKLLFALRFRSQQIFFANDITGASRVLFYRRIDERVARIAPFLEYDPDPYLVVADGRLFWIQDAYTLTGRYPYSTPARPGLSYIRNAVKVVVDAYHGDTTFYLADAKDPIAATYGRIFPGLFKPLAEMPAALRAHVRYPESMFTVQTAMYATFHMTNPATFYNREDQWEVPSLGDEGHSEAMEPYYTIMKLPGEATSEFIQMMPLTPRRKDNLAAWMAARSDGDRYGHLLVFRFPKQKVVFGPRQVVARINQDQVISPQITLWNQQGSQVIQGTLLVIPIEESLLYVRPLYLRSEGGRIPELKRVIVAYQNTIVMETTLEAALDRLFGSQPGPAPAATTDPAAARAAESAPPGGAPDQAALVGRARDHFERAQQALREGNWARYGEEITRLGEVLRQMQGPPR